MSYAMAAGLQAAIYDALAGDAALDAVVATGGILLVDEAYAEFAPRTVIDRVSDELPLVVSRTFSKTWSMAAARLGYLVAPSWLVSVLDRVVLPYHLNAVIQAAGETALTYVDEMDARVSTIIGERDRISARFDELGVPYWPSSSNFVLFRPESTASPESPASPESAERISAATVWQQLVDRQVLVRDCSTWPRLEGCLRVTVGTEAENDAFLDALAAILA